MYQEQQIKRKQIRLKEYDYSQEGYYYITICTKNRKKILSKIILNDENNVGVRFHPDPPKNIYNIRYTKIGKEIKKTIEFLNDKYKQIEIDEYIIMPNHVHLIICITGKGGTLPLQKIIIEFKTFTTKKYNIINNCFKNKLWQRNFYEHIIRNEKEYYLIKEYIINNPLKWENDIYF